MKVAFPVWEERVSPVLDTASKLLIINFEDQREASREEVLMDEQGLSLKSLRIQSQKVDELICGAVSRPFARMLAASGIQVIQGISGRIEDVLVAYLKGELSNSRFRMPGSGKNDIPERTT